jgi:hypothetical protein
MGWNPGLAGITGIFLVVAKYNELLFGIYWVRVNQSVKPVKPAGWAPPSILMRAR